MATSTAIIVASMIVVLAAGIGIGWGFQSTVASAPGGSVTTTTSTTTHTVTSNLTQGPYVLTMVITTENLFDPATGNQPAFYVLTPQGLGSSGDISLPANTLIKLVIVNYDSGNATLVGAQYANVKGTVNGTITYVNNANVNSSQGATGISVNGGATVTSVPQMVLAHTFTIPSLGINIPVPISSTVIAYIKITTSGSFVWFCETACGSGPTGLMGAMDTKGWMTGNLKVS